MSILTLRLSRQLERLMVNNTRRILQQHRRRTNYSRSNISNDSQYASTRDWQRVECRESSRNIHDIVNLIDVSEIKSDTKCPICMDDLWPESYKVDFLNQPEGSGHLPAKPVVCDHSFHLDCLKQWIATNPICPLCREPMVILTGYQPDTEGSRIVINNSPNSLPGFECSTIVIRFEIVGGVQGILQPLPGEKFQDFVFETYLPNNSEGKEVLRLLKIAWDRKLLFRIGYNPQTKKYDKVILNGLEMKTRRDGGMISNGYPDVSYMSRLKSDLGELSIR